MKNEYINLSKPDLIKKVKALQLIPYFEDIDPRNLKNIAANI